jgi:hypothetical protein
MLFPVHAMLCPCRSSQGHGTAWPSPCLASSGYHAEFHGDYCQKHTNPPHNDPYLRLKSGSSTIQIDDQLNCWNSSSDISGYHADFHEGRSTVRAGQGCGTARVNWRHSMAGARHAMCESALSQVLCKVGEGGGGACSMKLQLVWTYLQGLRGHMWMSLNSVSAY